MRTLVQVSGKLFVPAEESSVDCQVENLSASGAGVRCLEPPPLQTYIVLYVDHFGRFEGVTTRLLEGRLGVRFVCTPAKQHLLEQDLVNYINSGALPTASQRRHTRLAHSKTIGSFTRPNGIQVSCEVRDISLQGISLRTNARPPIGELINLGQTYGRVVRHQDDGIAVRFMSAMPKEALHDGR